MDVPKTPITPINETMALAQVADAIRDVVKELKQANQSLYAISEELTRGSHKPRP